MSGFKYKKVRNKFRWESDYMILEFSNPSIQGFSDYIQLQNENEIMYYYYTVKIFKKIVQWDDDDNEIVKLKLVADRWTHDFPTILQLKWILNYQLNDDSRIDGQKHEYQSGNIRYSKVMSTEGFACEDFYEITKSVNSEGEDEEYIVYCGTTFDLQGDLNSAGIRTPYIYRKDIEELLECVSSFIQYSLECHNKENRLWQHCYEIKNNKIYEYNSDNGKINKNKIESIYIIGDILDITTVVDNTENEFDKVVIFKIEGNNIILESGSIITSNSIVYMSDEVADYKLKYKEDEIAKDFLSILSSEEIEEFKNCNTDVLLEKYNMAIIGRTWMCRDEHEFNIDYNSGNRVGLVTSIVKDVINLIKGMI